MPWRVQVMKQERFSAQPKEEPAEFRRASLLQRGLWDRLRLRWFT